MNDLVARFRSFAAQARAAAPAPPLPPARPGLPAGWDLAPAPRGPIPVREEVFPFTGAPALAGPWPDRLAGQALGPAAGWRFLDLETTGLGGGAGTRAFLVGLGRLGPQGLTVRQYLLADLDREEAFLAAALADLAQATAVVTFNGKSFDWPLLRDRCLLAAAGVLPALPHWDVLHAARRLFGPGLSGGCDLRRLEAEVLGTPRGPDVQGADIPALYGVWLDGDHSALDGVVAHHREDIRALAGVAAALAEALTRGPESGAAPPLLWGLGRTYEHLGVTEAAVTCYLASRRAGMRPGGGAAARLLKRAGRPAEAAALWDQERRGPVPSLEAVEELAKDLEHRQHAPERALQVVLQAVPLAAAAGAARQEALRQRLNRLQRKVASRTEAARGAAGRKGERQRGGDDGRVGSTDGFGGNDGHGARAAQQLGTPGPGVRGGPGIRVHPVSHPAGGCVDRPGDGAL